MNKLKYSAIMAFILLGFITTIAQDKYKLINSSVRFFSSTPVEDIEAENKASLGVLDTKTGNFSVRVPITEFKFKSTLMEDHFNENYMESDKFPKSEFKGSIVNDNIVEYWDQPWEIEAHGYESGLFTKFVREEKLWEVFKGVQNPDSPIEPEPLGWKEMDI